MASPTETPTVTQCSQETRQVSPPSSVSEEAPASPDLLALLEYRRELTYELKDWREVLRQLEFILELVGSCCAAFENREGYEGIMIECDKFYKHVVEMLNQVEGKYVDFKKYNGDDEEDTPDPEVINKSLHAASVAEAKQILKDVIKAHEELSGKTGPLMARVRRDIMDEELNRKRRRTELNDAELEALRNIEHTEAELEQMIE